MGSRLVSASSPYGSARPEDILLRRISFESLLSTLRNSCYSENSFFTRSQHDIVTETLGAGKDLVEVVDT